MSPLSDVYWPAERTYQLTRRLLQILVDNPVFDWLLISTRSDLVRRDIDLFHGLGSKVEIGITIPTDREDVKAAFGRRNPALDRRFAAARSLMAAGVSTRIHVAPLQPHTATFVERLTDAAHWIWLDWHTHPGAGFGQAYAQLGWQTSNPEDVDSSATFSATGWAMTASALVRAISPIAGLPSSNVVSQTPRGVRWAGRQHAT